MLYVTNVSKSYGGKTVLAGVSFTLNWGEQAGLAGPNGAGKTTLLRLIAGMEAADGGSIRLEPEGVSVGYMAQALAFEPGDTVQVALERATPEYSRARTEMEHLAGLMADPGQSRHLPELTAAYAEAELRFEAAGGYSLENEMEAILAGLGLAEVPRELPVEHLSGGQKTRLALTGLLARRPQLLLLDEPTNHLDLDALAWLEGWLVDYKGAILLVSHDRTFLDRTTTRTLALDPATHTCRDFAGNYTAYTETMARETEQQWQAYQDQQAEIARLKSAARHLRGLARFRPGGKTDTNDKFARAFFANRSLATVGRAKQIEQRLERLLTEDRIEKPGRRWQLKLDLSGDTAGGRRVLSLENVSMAFGERVLFEHVTQTLSHGERVVLVGPNGEGKTTLLRLIAGELEPTAGQIHLGAGIRLGYLAQEQETLDPDRTPYDMIRAEAAHMSQAEARSFLHYFLFSGDEVFTPVGRLSFGERTRLMLARLVVQGCNFLLLDEPVNHLDIASREHFEQALNQFPGTILAVAHDRTFIRHIASGVWELRAGRVQVWRDLSQLAL